MHTPTRIFAAFLFFLIHTGLARAEPAPIDIGSILILTGQGSAWGTAAKNGIDLAVEDVNAAGGVLGRKLHVHHEDDQADPKKTLSAFHHLTGIDGIRFIIGPNWSTLGLPLVEPAEKKGVLIISPSLGMAKFNESHALLFNTWPHDNLLSEHLAHYVFGKGHRNVALIGAEEVWVKEQTNAFRTAFEKLGGKIGFIAEPLPTTTDLRTEAIRIKKTAGIDAYVTTTDGVLIGSLLAKALDDLGMKLPKYSITIDQQAIDGAHGGFENLEFLTFLTPSAEFKKRYEERFKVTIDIGADSAYDAVRMLAVAIEKAGEPAPPIVAKELSAVKEYRGVSGELISDGRRGFTKKFAIKKVIGGFPADLPTPAR